MNQLYFYNIQFIKLGRNKQLNMEEILKVNVLILKIVNQGWARGTAAAARGPGWLPTCILQRGNPW